MREEDVDYLPSDGLPPFFDMKELLSSISLPPLLCLELCDDFVLSPAEFC
jgi:hypothetical protein